jgi:hypothetical protein
VRAGRASRKHLNGGRISSARSDSIREGAGA